MFQAILKSAPNEDICFLVRPDNHPWNYICECGEASGLDIADIKNTRAVFISHTHIDHFIQFDALIRHQVGLQCRVVVCGPAGLARQVQARLSSYTWNLVEPEAIVYEIRELVADGEIQRYETAPPEWPLIHSGRMPGNVVFSTDTFEVSAVLLDHKIPTMAYLFREKDTVNIRLEGSGFSGGPWVAELKKAFEEGAADRSVQVAQQVYRAGELFHLLYHKAGDTLGIIMDHGASPENHAKIVAHFEGCRKVFIECFYKNEDALLADTHQHSYAAMSGAVMRRAGVQDAVPVHFSRKYQDADLEQIRQEFQAGYSGG